MGPSDFVKSILARAGFKQTDVGSIDCWISSGLAVILVTQNLVMKIWNNHEILIEDSHSNIDLIILMLPEAEWHLHEDIEAEWHWHEDIIVRYP